MASCKNNKRRLTLNTLYPTFSITEDCGISMHSLRIAQVARLDLALIPTPGALVIPRYSCSVPGRRLRLAVFEVNRHFSLLNKNSGIEIQVSLLCKPFCENALILIISQMIVNEMNAYANSPVCPSLVPISTAAYPSQSFQSTISRNDSELVSFIS